MAADSTFIDASLRAQLLTSVAALEADRGAIAAEIAALTLKLEDVDRRIAGARQFLGEGGGEAPPSARTSAVATAPEAPKARSGEALKTPKGRTPQRGSWTEFLFDRLSGIDGGMTIKELTATIPGTEWAEKHASSRNGFYTMLGKLEEGGALIRRNGVIYLPETLAKIDAGEIVEPQRPPEQSKRGAYLLIERVVRDAGKPLKAGEVVDLMREMPEAEPFLRRNTQLVYATLSRMVGAGILERDFRGFYTAPAKPEAERTLRLVQGGAAEGEPM